MQRSVAAQGAETKCRALNRTARASPQRVSLVSQSIQLSQAWTSDLANYEVISKGCLNQKCAVGYYKVSEVVLRLPDTK